MGESVLTVITSQENSTKTKIILVTSQWRKEGGGRVFCDKRERVENYKNRIS